MLGEHEPAGQEGRRGLGTQASSMVQCHTKAQRCEEEWIWRLKNTVEEEEAKELSKPLD